MSGDGVGYAYNRVKQFSPAELAFMRAGAQGLDPAEASRKAEGLSVDQKSAWNAWYEGNKAYESGNGEALTDAIDKAASLDRKSESGIMEEEKERAYEVLIRKGELTPLADFELYKSMSKEIDDKLIGIVTSDNITITGKTNHCIARVIGSVEQRRNGVQVSDILDLLTSGDSEILPIRVMKNGRSQKFRNKVVEVSVNPDTGSIIQVNPVHTRKKDKS